MADVFYTFPMSYFVYAILVQKILVIYSAHSKVDGLARILLTLAIPMLQGHSSTTLERHVGMFTPKVAYALYAFLSADIQSIIYSFLEYSTPAPEPLDLTREMS